MTWHQSDRSTDLPFYPDEDNSISPVTKRFFTAEGCDQKINTAEGCDTKYITTKGCVKQLDSAKG